MSMKKTAKLIGRKQWKYFVRWLYESTFRSEPRIVTLPVTTTLPPSDAVGAAKTRYEAYRAKLICMTKEETP